MKRVRRLIPVLLAGSMIIDRVAPAEPALRLHADLVAAWQTTGIDVENAAAVFDHVFARLPADADVLPTENYFYWQLVVDGRELRGNFRLPPDDRAHGCLRFAYSEWEEFPGSDHPQRLRKELVPAGPVARCGRLHVEGCARRKERQFHLNRLAQDPPKLFALKPGEVFVQRTFDESGLAFFLIFDGGRHDFLLDPQ